MEMTHNQWDLSTLGTSGGLSEDEQALIAREIVENRTGITDVAELVRCSSRRSYSGTFT